MRTLLTLALAAGLLQPAAGDLYELDVVVLDRKDRPVLDLVREDFQVKENGRPVDVKTFVPASSAGAEGRQVVLLLDDASVPLGGTPIVQAIARDVVAHGKPEDEVTVVRLNNDRDEPFGDIDTALQRIDEYRAGAVPFQSRGAADRALRVIAAISRHLAAVEHRRKLIVCIGGPRVCNVQEPQQGGSGALWPTWVAALGAAADANVAVYAIMPVAPGAPLPVGGGLAELTGGGEFYNRSNFDRFVTGMWTEAGQYYLLGYWPAASRRALRTIDVRVGRKGVRVHVRRRRG